MPSKLKNKNFRINGTTIRKLRERKGLSQKALSEEVKISYRSIQRIETDGNYFCSQKNLTKLSLFFDVKEQDLILVPDEGINVTQDETETEKEESTYFRGFVDIDDMQGLEEPAEVKTINISSDVDDFNFQNIKENENNFYIDYFFLENFGDYQNENIKRINDKYEATEISQPLNQILLSLLLDLKFQIMTFEQIDAFLSFELFPWQKSKNPSDSYWSYLKEHWSEISQDFEKLLKIAKQSKKEKLHRPSENCDGSISRKVININQFYNFLKSCHYYHFEYPITTSDEIINSLSEFMDKLESTLNRIDRVRISDELKEQAGIKEMIDDLSKKDFWVFFTVWNAKNTRYEEGLSGIDTYEVTTIYLKVVIENYKSKKVLDKDSYCGLNFDEIESAFRVCVDENGKERNPDYKRIS